MSHPPELPATLAEALEQARLCGLLLAEYLEFITDERKAYFSAQD